MNVIELASRRKPKPKPKPPQYCCAKCEGLKFLVYEGGAVECAKCGANINNFRVIMANWIS